MRIKVLFTGGTIGSSVNDGSVIATDSAFAGKLLLENYLLKNSSKYRSAVTFDVSEPYSCLSEDLTIDTFNQLIAALKKVDFTAYDGVVITHGTDTMAYTANLLSILLGGISVPVVLVGSNHVLSDPRANGNQNFADAIALIAERKYPGVYVVFSGKIYLGSRILQCRPFVDDYASVSGHVFATVQNDCVLPDPAPENPDSRALLLRTSKKMLLHTIPPLSKSVLLVQPYVGLDYRNLCPDADIKAILHGLYHSATACVGSGKSSHSSILSLCENCKEWGIALFIAPFKQSLLSKEAMYATTEELLRYGVQMANDMSLEMAYVKLLVAFALHPNDPPAAAAFLNEPIFFEQLTEFE